MKKSIDKNSSIENNINSDTLYQTKVETPLLNEKDIDDSELFLNDEDILEEDILEIENELNDIDDIKVDNIKKDNIVLDSDNDNVNDENDLCPDTPLGVEVDKTGCPFDSDADGVYDYKDRCSNTPLRAKVDKFGCEIKRVAKKILKVKFEKNSTRLTYNSFGEVLRFSDFLKKYPKYDAQIIAYTDNDRGIKLARDRARAIKEALIIEGIDASRLEVFAYSKNIITKHNKDINTIIEVKILY